METSANMNVSLPSVANTTRAGLFERIFLKEYIITGRVLTPTWPIIFLFGLVSNTINIAVFIKTGMKDNVTILLVSLALSDFTFLCLATPSMSAFVILTYARNWQWPFDYRFASFLFYWPAFTAYDLSAFISVTLSVVRCACVAMPLKFKLVFTTSRTIKMVLLLVILAVSLRVPVLTIFRVAWRTDPSTNVSSVYVRPVNRVAMSQINDILNRGFVVWFNYAIVITCVSVLSYKLYQASKIRRSCIANNQPETIDQASEKTATLGLSPKDLQVIKSVVLVCSIFILSQLPFMLYSTARLIRPELSASSEYGPLFAIFTNISQTCSYLNASLNIFVYYNYNSRFRAVFLAMVA
ncbi:chemosensory receptor A [Elysia marginata]|uniref:Chemosensory receptor A n=1 Tax=Elysia marginata TaxID=1093978 RepID=A0AAV4I445_9GAST|nr:chemosensory receptor A [Elysia marginata]